MKKILLTFLLILPAFLSPGLLAQSAGKISPAPTETAVFRFLPGDNMFYGPLEGNRDELNRLYEIIDRYRDRIVSGAIPVCVDAYTASSARQRTNLNLSFVRANRVKSELIVHKGLLEDNFVTRNFTTAYDGHKDIVVVTLTIPVEAPPPAPVREPEPDPVPEPEPAVCPESRPDDPMESLPVEKEQFKMSVDLRTNLIYDALLTPTLGLEWRISPKIGLKVDGSYAHWGSSNGRVQKMWLISPEVRWYLLTDRRFYIGLGANIGEVNVYKGLARVVSKTTGYQGNIYGGGVTLGYRLPLGCSFAMDFNLGLGCTHLSYDSFYLSNEVRVYRERDLSKNIWGPTQAGVTIIWNIGGKNNK